MEPEVTQYPVQVYLDKEGENAAYCRRYRNTAKGREAAKRGSDARTARNRVAALARLMANDEQKTQTV